MPDPDAARLAQAEADHHRRRRLLIAYLLDVFLGTLGLHRFYLHRNGSGLAMLLITVGTLGLGLLITVPWVIVDLFLIPGIARSDNADQLDVTRVGSGLPPPDLGDLPPWKLPPPGGVPLF
jgi:TM2 domain-containing membrane protein YozV